MAMDKNAWKEKVVLDNVDTAIIPFWDGLKKHEFLLYRCNQCGTHYWPAAYCRNCSDMPSLDSMKWVPTSGRGTIFSSLIFHQTTDPVYALDTPYCMALVELEEGPLFGTRIVGCDPKDAVIGMPVEVVYDDVKATGLTLPLFKPRR